MLADLRRQIVSARPNRAALLTALFALIAGALVVSFGAADTEDPLTIDAGAGAEASATAGAATEDDSSESGTISAADQPAGPSAELSTRTSGRGSGQPVDYDEAVSALAVADALAFGSYDEGVLSAEPETTTTTEAPTTTAPSTTTTTEAETTSSETVEETTSTSTDGTETTDTTTPDSTDTTDTTTPDTTETTGTTQPPETTAHPDGWVDAGHGVFVPQVLLSIRFCESTDNYQAANPSSSARGAYQFLRSSWADYGHAARYGVSEAHLATNAQQDEAALLTWQRDGTRPWNASRSCWG